ncbi:MAG: heme exporter protein CcmB [Candidatus Marinimicrobia bacterium]|nr:heme exporter protein CcmB [Candidatus Neomarinimicrobiota bacterium]
MLFNTLLCHEFKINFRTKEAFFSMLSFGMIMIVTFAFSLNISEEQIVSIIPGFFWMTVLFVSVLGINRMFFHELTFNAISLLSSAPVDRGLIFFTKTIIGLVYLSIIESVLIILIWFLFHVSFFNLPVLSFGLLILGNLSILVTGVFISGLTLSSRMSNVLVPLLMFPLLSPVIISLTKATQGLLQGLPITEWEIWILIISTYCVVFALLGYGLFDYLMEE